MIDSHAHIEMFKKDAPRIAEESRKRLRAVVDSITEYRKFHVWKSWELLKPYFGFIFPTLGYAPNEARRGNWEKVKKVEEFIIGHRDEIVAIGEIGLDYYYAKTPEERKNQREIFHHFLDLAVELNLPVVLHARDAELEVFEAVQRAGVKAYFHSYSGPRELALEIAEGGHIIGVNTGIDFIPAVREVAEVLPLESMVLETDAPYMSPYKGERNYPWNVEYAVKRVAELKGADFKEVERVTERNVVDFFGLKL
ncbi:YchF/TatD family DNA exonuclease [Thermococcus thioreducens]|uniref:Deoxyribonuclease n=1 Tax=Thermococcus thioreducens TaxID=277988 RepID=A0A0Q2MRC5_9EURY|nr:YchF/TatD family DNA exonuclease [Thermococcus thioreducens]ASJ12785.1 deoxyribonuclease [Thermococcus thioreducens]KQH82255.1 deoxyribonuclease [Thermococcus thioreducens]SEV85256.1 TatD DNase family protein [Thermococcus thioreducens]